MKGIRKMKKNNVITNEEKMAKKKVLAKNLTIMLLTIAIMAIFVPVVSADGTDADSAYKQIMGELIKWFKRIGSVVAFVGGIMFALAIKNNDADQKQTGLLTLVAGFAVVAICGIASTFGVDSEEIVDKSSSTTTSIIDEIEYDDEIDFIKI